MLSFLFRGLTAKPARGAPLFDLATGEARQPGWYREGAVPDTIDGRFAVLATVTAMMLVKLESEGEAGNAASVALTERFIEVMESEHRELGLGDPTLGKTVRKLVGMLARRTDVVREAGDRFEQIARECLYKDEVDGPELRHSARMLRDFSSRLDKTGLDQLEQGKIG